MSTLWKMGVSFVLVWIAQSVGVADNFPIYGATGLLISLLIICLLESFNYHFFKKDIRKIFREELGKRV